MGVYSKALHHVNNKNFKKTRQRHLDEEKILSLKVRKQEILEQQEIKQIKEISSPLKSDWKSELFPEVKQEVKKEEVKVKVKVPEKLKSDWKKELAEGMTTSGGEIQFAPSDVPLDTIDAADPASFTAQGAFDTTDPQDGLSGAQIVPNGTGTGNNGGFNLGKNYLSFNGVGFDAVDIPEFDNTRFVILTPIDTTRATTLEITAIVGNNSNGGEAPGVEQDLLLGWVVDPNTVDYVYDDNGDPIVVVPYNGSGSLRTYSVTIPSYLRKSGVQFSLAQYQGINPTTTGDNYGITEIKVKRTTPISVMAPLDTPEAVSFFRVGPTPNSPNYETPEQRYRRVMQQLLASKNYTNQMFGSNYPGSNFSGLRGVVQPPTWEQAAQAAPAAPGTDDYYYKLGGGDYSLQLFQKQGQNKTRQDIIDRGKKLLASNQKYIDSQKQKTTTSKLSGPIGTVKAASLAAAASKAATPKPVPKPISLKGTDLQGKPLKPGVQSPTPPGYKGTFKPGPLTGKDIPKSSTQTSKPSVGFKIDEPLNPPKTRIIGPASPSKPSLNLTSKQQANIKSATGQLKSLSGPATKILSTLAKPGGASLSQFGPNIFKQGQTGSATYKAVNQAAKVVPGLKANPSTDIGKKAGTAIANFITQKPSSSNLGGPKGTGASTIKSSTTKSQTVGSSKPAPAPKPSTTARKK